MGFYILYLFWYVKRCSIFSLSVSHKNYWMCADDLDEKKNAKLKVILEDYFHDQTDFKAVVENTEEEVSTNTNYMSSVVFITITLSKNNVSFAASQPMNCCFHDMASLSTMSVLFLLGTFVARNGYNLFRVDSNNAHMCLVFFSFLNNFLSLVHHIKCFVYLCINISIKIMWFLLICKYHIF